MTSPIEETTIAPGSFFQSKPSRGHPAGLARKTDQLTDLISKNLDIWLGNLEDLLRGIWHPIQMLRQLFARHWYQDRPGSELSFVSPYSG